MLALCTYIGFFSYLHPFTPGKWSQIDRFVKKNNIKKPSGEIARDANGKTIYSAKYFYQNGLIQREEYYNKDGKKQGYVQYSYKNKILRGEKLYNSADRLQEEKVFQYSKEGLLEKMLVKNRSGKIEIYYKIKQTGQDALFNVDILWANARDQEFYVVRKDYDSDHIFYQDIFNTAREKVGTTKYMYSKSGKLISRLNIQRKRYRQQNLKFDKDGVLKKISFHVKRGKKWFKVKEHELLYTNSEQLKDESETTAKTK